MVDAKEAAREIRALADMIESGQVLIKRIEFKQDVKTDGLGFARPAQLIVGPNRELHAEYVYTKEVV